MSAIRRHPWRVVLVLALVIALAVLIAALIYMNTHTPGEWLMQKRLELENDGTHRPLRGPAAVRSPAAG